MPAKNLSHIEADLLVVITSRKWVNDNNYVVFLRSNNEYESDSWALGDQLYILLSLQVDNLLNFLT